MSMTSFKHSPVRSSTGAFAKLRFERPTSPQRQPQGSKYRTTGYLGLLYLESKLWVLGRYLIVGYLDSFCKGPSTQIDGISPHVESLDIQYLGYFGTLRAISIIDPVSPSLPTFNWPEPLAGDIYAADEPLYGF